VKRSKKPLTTLINLSSPSSTFAPLSSVQAAVGGIPTVSTAAGVLCAVDTRTEKLTNTGTSFGGLRVECPPPYTHTHRHFCNVQAFFLFFRKPGSIPRFAGFAL